ncbi:MAG: hypothetical protein JJ900_12825 [Rhodospirillales bacterium]|nr:hypothetical protein [Rhodospirillales bacterium]MBO6787729.1 hypothetical protein [Rhodospirillales bacterium]
MFIGIDFDNTIACYDELFAVAAADHGHVPPGTASTKSQVKQAVLRNPDGERHWMTLQGEVYGARMAGASMMPGLGDFLTACKERGVPVAIISHKTIYGHHDPRRVNLRDAARGWMHDQGFFDGDGFGIDERHLYFESTREEKVHRIGRVGCTHFIDDLPEVFEEPGFPDGLDAILYDPAGSLSPPAGVRSSADWRSIQNMVFGGDD